MERKVESLAIDTLKSPLGTLLVVFDADARLWSLDFEDHVERMRASLRRRTRRTETPPSQRAPKVVCEAIDAYFAGDLGALDALTVRAGGSAFQARVWSALRAIPAGTTTTYGELARTIGRPTASRAVGTANGSNPIGIVVPCHRVIGADGALTGYAGGLERKRWLLAHEREASQR